MNEDPAMVKYLLDQGADYDVQACGNFFTPDDQRHSRTDCLDHEWVELCKETNYQGYVIKLYMLDIKKYCFVNTRLKSILVVIEANSHIKK